MIDLGTLRLNIKADSKSAEEGLEDVEKKTKDAEQQTDKSTKKMGDSWKKFGNVLKGGVIASLAAVGAAIGASISTAVENAADLGKLENAFDQAGYSAETAGDTFNSFVGLMGETDTAIEASNHLAKLCKSEEELAQWSDIAAGVYATFGDSIPLEGLTEAANETAKTGKVTGSLADALNWVGMSEDEFNAKLAECNDETERAKLVTETLNGAYAEAGEQYRKNNEAIVSYNEAHADLIKNMTALGTCMLPAVTGLMQLGSAIAQLSSYMLTSNDSVSTMVSNITGGFDNIAANAPAQIESIVSGFANGFMKIGEVIGGMLPSLGSMMGTIGASIVQQLPTLLTSIVTGLVNMIPGLLQGAINFFMALVQALPIVITELCTQLPLLIQQVVNILPTLIPMLLAAAIQLFNALVQSLPIILPALINGAISCIDSIVAMLPTLIPMLLDAAITLFLALVNALPEILPELINAVGDAITAVLEYLPEFMSTMQETAKTLFNKICEAVPTILGDLKTALGDLITKGIEAIKDKASDIKQAGIDMIQGFIDGILEAPEKVVNAMTNVVQGGVDAVMSLLESHSPSRLFKRIGGFTMEGFEIGIEANTEDAVRAMTNASQAIASAFDVTAPDVTGQFRSFVNSKRRGSDGAQSNPGTNNVVTVNNYSPKALSEKETAREYRRSMRQLAMA